eukprot:170669-Pelagomonas_calceolata.AAC.1
MRGALMWIGWVSGSTLLQGISVVMSVFIFNGMSCRGYGQCNGSTYTQEDWVPVDNNLCTLELFAQFAVLLL